jgi:hypothetical protein
MGFRCQTEPRPVFLASSSISNPSEADMNIKKTALTLLLLAVGLIGSFAIAQQGKIDPTNRPQQMDAAELEGISAQPSLEQGILRIAAEKLRQENRPMTTVELPATVRVTKAPLPLCAYQTCVKVGNKWACKYNHCDALK